MMAAPLHCVRCKLELHAPSATASLSCASCGGEFCTREALSAILARARELAQPQHYLRPKLSLSEPIRYVTCPACGELMQRRNFGESSGVIVDICRAHGVWFDRGELRQITAFCASGELARAELAAAARDQARQSMDGFQRSLNGPAPNPNRWDALDAVDALNVVDLFIELIASIDL